MSPDLHAAFGVACQAPLLAWLAWKITARTPARQRRLFAAGTAALSLIPLADGISAAMAVRALWGDPSITTVQLLILSLAGRPANIGRLPASALVLFGLTFYPLALGFGDFDPYHIGYAGWPIVLILSVAALAAWRRGEPVFVWLLAVDLAAFALGLHESNNLWDILFDPLLVGAALFRALRRS